MRKQKWYKVAGVLLLAGMLNCFTGCEKEITTEDITASEEYQKLDTQYASLERKYEKLKSQLAEQKTTEQESNSQATEYFNKIKKSVFVKVRYGHLKGNNSHEISENKSLCKWLKKSLGASVELSNVNADEFTAEQEPVYSYILYNEDNTVCECSIYKNDYVIFSELPDTVYYVADITRLGDAAFVNEELLKAPKQSVYSDLYDSRIVFQGERLLTIEEGRMVASAFYQGHFKELKTEPMDVEEDSIQEYRFMYNGTTYKLKLYKQYISLQKDSEERVWYIAAKEDIKYLTQLLEK